MLPRLASEGRFRSSPLGPVDPSFRALSGRLKFTVRHHKLIKVLFSEGLRGRDAARIEVAGARLGVERMCAAPEREGSNKLVDFHLENIYF